MTSNKKRSTSLGIIEGFFGKAWSWQDRQDYAEFLKAQSYNFYIYAPKNDRHLRMNWQQDWPTETRAQLTQLRETYGTAGIHFGIGLSPHEIYRDASRDQREQLRKRVRQLNQLAPDILCILFDDMRGDIPQLANIQIDIAHEAAELTCAKRLIFCPTYYSFDPVLEKVFGTMPEDYWQTFARRLDPAIDIFWTGEKVCSARYSIDHLDTVTSLLGRQPFLWDNYPVNDGAVKSQLLQLRAFDQSHSQLEGHLSGHAVNPMNQPWLSKIPLASLPRAYDDAQAYNPESVFQEMITTLCGPALAEQLREDITQFQDKGLNQLSAEEQARLRHTYAQFPDNPYAQEILAWLNGGYAFDPACLTE